MFPRVDKVSRERKILKAHITVPLLTFKRYVNISVVMSNDLIQCPITYLMSSPIGTAKLIVVH